MLNQSILEKVAQQNNTTVEEVRSEIRRAIQAAMSNPEPAVQERLASVAKTGSEPTPEELIDYLVQRVVQEVK